MSLLFFWIFSTIAVASALSILFVRRPTRALLALLLSMLCLTVLYTLLHAYFVAIVHLIVYAGAVLVLFLFVIMLQGLGVTTLPLFERFHLSHLLLTFTAGIFFTALLTFVFFKSKLPELQDSHGTVENLGKVLFTHYLLPFELVSILILIGIFAAVAFAKKTKPAL